MEEDIKILEELIEEGFSAMCPLEAQAIENLIKGYRELEEKLNTSISCCCELFELIPKSKIKEKMEEYKQEMKEIRAKEKGLIWNHRLHKLDYAIQVLQELLEDK